MCGRATGIICLSRLPAARRADVSFIPLVTPDELPDKLAEFDLGLALEPSWPRNRDVTISNKIFQYLNAGLALIATDTAGQNEVMHAAPECGLLIQAHETTRLAAQLDELLGNRERLRACQVASRAAAITQFNWGHAAPRLLAAVDRGAHNRIVRLDQYAHDSPPAPHPCAGRVLARLAGPATRQGGHPESRQLALPAFAPMPEPAVPAAHRALHHLRTAPGRRNPSAAAC